MTSLIKRQPIGTLITYFDEKQNGISAKLPLYEGENIIGRDNLKCDVVMGLKEISPVHCKITLNKFNEFSIEDLDSQYGVYKLNPNFPLEQKQKLKPGKEYELVESKPFYISKYRCLFLNSTDQLNKAPSAATVDKEAVETSKKSKIYKVFLSVIIEKETKNGGE